MKNITKLFLLAICCVLALSACGSKKRQYYPSPAGNVTAQDLRSQEALLEQAERINSLERKLTDIDKRLEALEFIQVERIDSIRRNTLQASRSQELRQETTQRTLDVKKNTGTSTLVPLNILVQDRNARLADAKNQYLFQIALDKIEDRQFEAAEAELTQVYNAVRYTNDAPIVTFWKAVISEVLSFNREAIAAYAEIVGRHSNHPRAAVALLRQAFIFSRLGEDKLAKATLEKLVKEYPRSPAAQKAKFKLRNLD